MVFFFCVARLLFLLEDETMNLKPLSARITMCRNMSENCLTLSTLRFEVYFNIVFGHHPNLYGDRKGLYWLSINSLMFVGLHP